jgi:phage shock protein PspC (stress-responsive transcriptional regulator)
MQDALPAIQDRPKTTNLFLRDDTLFGVCEGIGEEFGFNPNFLRVPFAAGILWNPAAIVGIYLGLGAALALARWIYPKPQATASHQVDSDHSARPANADADELSIAA